MYDTVMDVFIRLLWLNGKVEFENPCIFHLITTLYTIPNDTVHRFIMGDDITINVAFIGNKEKGYKR